MKPYYTIITRDGLDSPWAPQFGCFNRDVVAQEMADTYADRLSSSYVPKAHRRIIVTDSRKSSIDAEIARLNVRPGSKAHLDNLSKFFGL